MSDRETYFRKQGWWKDEILMDWLDARAAVQGQALALSGTGEPVSYAGLKQRVESFARGLERQGIGKGDIVAVHLPNIPEFIVAWFAIGAIGAIMQTIHMPYGIKEVEHLLGHSGAKAVLALGETKDRSPAGEIALLRGRLKALTTVIAVGKPAMGCLSFKDLTENDGPPKSARPKATDGYMQLYTSGTTSSPKAARVTYNHFLSNARLCADELDIRSDDRILCAAPFTHLYGLYACELGFSQGAAAVLLPLFSPPDFVKLLKEQKPTILIAGPAHIAACLQAGLLKDVDFSAMRFAVLSGTTVPPALSQALEDLMPHGKVLQAWGMTELQFGACSRTEDLKEIRFQSIGRATPGTELRIANDAGRTLGAGEPGELQIRGCSLFSGYVGNDEANKAAFAADGWFRTGDLATMDAGGNVVLTGRTKEIINRGGIKINPIDVEIAIAAHPAVAQVAIAPMPDPILGERACCFVVLRDGQNLDLDGLKDFLGGTGIAKMRWPEHLQIVADMPMTPTRKVIKGELVKMLQAG
jgi:cyclohexanecarboxylate-CoA ligase